MSARAAKRTNLPALVAETPLTPQPPAIVLFGRDGGGRPRAAWFEAGDERAASEAAVAMRLRTLALADEPSRELARQFARGCVLPSGRAVVPFAKRELYSRLIALAGEEAGLSVTEGEPTAGIAPEAAGTASQAGATEPPRAPRPSDHTFVGQPDPKDRSEIGLGSIVLAHESAEEGWWEAEVIGCNGRVFSLRWRDFPTQPTILRKAGELALLPPGEP